MQKKTTPPRPAALIPPHLAPPAALPTGRHPRSFALRGTATHQNAICPSARAARTTSSRWEVGGAHAVSLYGVQPRIRMRFAHRYARHEPPAPGGPCMPAVVTSGDHSQAQRLTGSRNEELAVAFDSHRMVQSSIAASVGSGNNTHI